MINPPLVLWHMEQNRSYTHQVFSPMSDHPISICTELIGNAILSALCSSSPINQSEVQSRASSKWQRAHLFLYYK